ncbi:hypothetical protein [Demequina zhanjiangensis]|uniref:Uncharacterized protein n=1 Tax=Demequina zhanjiangensis TaxID=3051659 RepID=A0ABT8G4K0_9MICO|nr:hypothetical protein [Demequina sp. SYSU T00b26]MDN4474060.1 hypothetical protein [Demequina sp. SYSU T00b26]
MSFEEIFAPGLGRAKEELEREKILPAPAPIAGAPLPPPPPDGVEIPSLDDLEPFDDE